MASVAAPQLQQPCCRRTGFGAAAVRLAAPTLLHSQQANTPAAGAAAGMHVVAAAGGKSTSGGAGSKGFGAAAKAPSIPKTQSAASQTCACGSKLIYRLCCEPFHTGQAVPPDVEAALRARFCAFVKGRTGYIVSTFHPNYHSFKYEGSAPGGSLDQLRRDVEAAVKRFAFSKLKVLRMEPGSHAEEAFITFQYTSVNKINPERNFDGTIKPSTTVERSRFLRDGPTGQWLFVDYTLIDYPSWMADAKEAEERARKEAAAAAPS